MQSKPLDTSYCQVDRCKIERANPLLDEDMLIHFYNWMKERYTIHLRKDIHKEEKPWTDNQILRKYKFTNVRREHDRQTKWLIKNIVQSNLEYGAKLLNIVLFRLYNKYGTFEALHLPKKIFEEHQIKKDIEEYSHSYPSYVWFSNAFFTSGPKATANRLFGKDNPAIQMIKLVNRYKDNNLIMQIKEAKSQHEVVEKLLQQPGIGSFLAYQIFVDFTYIKEFPFSENEFTIAGPGCKKGLKYLFKDMKGLSPEEALFWLRDNQNFLLKPLGYDPITLFEDLPLEDRTLNVMSLENCMCEFSKYIRALKGKGRPRLRYNGF